MFVDFAVLLENFVWLKRANLILLEEKIVDKECLIELFFRLSEILKNS